eukprot:gene975-290_t
MNSTNTLKYISELYRTLKERIGMKESIPYTKIEDETVIEPHPEYDQRCNTVWGYCALKGNHVCQDYYVLSVDDNEDACAKLIKGMEQSQLATNAKVININPLHASLLRVVLHLQATCNKFTHETVLRQWKLYDSLCKQLLDPLLGPGIGNGSDGDSRCRKIFLLESQSSDAWIWRNYVVKSADLTLKENFVTRETFLDVLLSAHSAVSVIAWFAENHSDVPCFLHLLGTDAVEVYFSQNGSWLINKHTHTIMDMTRNLTAINWLNQTEEVVIAWKAGVEAAIEMALRSGMIKKNSRFDDDWIRDPFGFIEVEGMLDEMLTEEEITSHARPTEFTSEDGVLSFEENEEESVIDESIDQSLLIGGQNA